MMKLLTKSTRPDILLMFSDPNADVPDPHGDDLISGPESSSGEIKIISTNEIYARMPAEIIWRVLRFLPSKDVCNARLASRWIASISTPKLLPQEFWSSRFSPDREFAHIMAHRKLASADDRKLWREYYWKCIQFTKKPNDEDDPDDVQKLRSVQNRRRIYRCVEEFAISAEQIIRADASTNIHLLEAPFRQPLGRFNKDGQRLACPIVGRENIHMERFRYGVRPIMEQSISLSLPLTRCIMILGVSFLSFNCQQFIVGMRTYWRDNFSKVQVIESVGLIIPSTEQTIELALVDSITRIDIVTSFLGIHGLAFHVQDPTTVAVKVVGTTSCLHNFYGKATITPRSPMSGLLLRFDVRAPLLPYAADQANNRR